MDFTALKTAIQNAVKLNGNEEITGDILQGVLLSMVNTLGDSAINDLISALANEVADRQNADGTLQTNITNEATARGNADTALGNRIDNEATARENADTALSNRITAITDAIDNGYVYAGIATTSTEPVTGKVFYLTTATGVFTNFGGITVNTKGIKILKMEGSTWTSDTVIVMDDTPTENSTNLVKSGGVYASIASVLSKIAEGYLYVGIATAATNPSTPTIKVFYIATAAGTYTNFLDSSSQPLILTQGINILKFNGTSWSAEQVWGVDDDPNPTSNNLTKSKGVYDAIHSLSLNNFNVGANNNAASQHIYGLIPNQKYLLTFVDINWDITGVTNHSQFKLCLFGVKNGQRVETMTQVPVDSTVNKYYVFTYGDWDSLEVFIRATQDVKVYYTISSEEIPNLISFDKKVQVYNNENGYPIIKKVGTSLYFKSSNGRWSARCALNLNYGTNEDLATALGVELVDISETDTGYIELQSTYSFVLSSSSNRLYIKSRDAVTLNDIVLLANVEGFIKSLNTDIFGFPYIDNRFNGIESNIEHLKNACDSYIGSIQRFVIPYSATVGQWRIFNFGLPQGWKFVLEVSSSTPEWINYIRLLNSPDGVSYGSSLGNFYIRNNKIEYIAQADIPFLGLQLTLDGLKKDGSDNVIGGTVDFLLKVEKDYVSPYIIENTNVLIPQIRSHRTSKSATICFFTDLHNIAYTSTYNSENSVIKVIRHIVQGINIIKKSINIWTTIAGGDYLLNNDSTLKSVAIESLYDLSDTLDKVEGMPKLIVKGNHDDNSMGALANMIEPDTYYKMLPLMFESNEVVIDASNPSGNYGYFDIKPQKMRIIYLNSVDIPWIEEGGSVRYKGQWTCGVQQAQLNFVADALRFEEEGWSVMFVSHHCITPIANFADGASEYVPAANGGSQLLGIIEAFKNKTSFNGTITGDFASVVNVDYTNNASNGIICLLNGHTHADRNAVKDGMLFLATTTATQSNTYPNTDGSTYAPTPNSKNEGAADFITIDKLNGIIYLDRYGFGVSRKFYYTGEDIGDIPE